jgi:hypothetical protein
LQEIGFIEPFAGDWRSVAGIDEGARLEYRLESFNALNHSVFFAANLGVASGQFGLVTGQCNSPREAQMGLTFYRYDLPSAGRGRAGPPSFLYRARQNDWITASVP